MSKELKKVMKKLKKKKEKVIEEEDEEEDEDEDLDEEEDEEEEEKKPVKKSKLSKEDLIKAEVDMLQNDGIFRRELLAILHRIADALTEDAKED
jgi:hypothetical protein